MALAVVVWALGPLWAALPVWVTLVTKAGVISAGYAGLLWLTERDQLRTGWQVVSEQLPSSPLIDALLGKMRRRPATPVERESRP